MKNIRFLLFLAFCLPVCLRLDAQKLKLLTWNIQYFGSSKHEAELNYIADVVKDYDVVAIQEVVTNPSGVQTLARLADLLNRKGDKWSYVHSDPTDSPPYKTERYAFLWKSNQLKLKGRPVLWSEMAHIIDREPYIARFSWGKRSLVLVNYHSRLYNQQPERESKYFKYLPSAFAGEVLIFLGDFNVPPWHTVFIPLKKMGYRQVVTEHKTTLKRKCGNGGEYLSHSIDNILYPAHRVKRTGGGVLDLVGDCHRLKRIRKISDHLPVWVEVE